MWYVPNEEKGGRAWHTISAVGIFPGSDMWQRLMKLSTVSSDFWKKRQFYMSHCWEKTQQLFFQVVNRKLHQKTKVKPIDALGLAFKESYKDNQHMPVKVR